MIENVNFSCSRVEPTRVYRNIKTDACDLLMIWIGNSETVGYNIAEPNGPRVITIRQARAQVPAALVPAAGRSILRRARNQSDSDWAWIWHISGIFAERSQCHILCTLPAYIS